MRYEDIINIERPSSKYPKMPPSQRAAIFSPFAALRGFEEAIEEEGKEREERKILTEEEKSKIEKDILSLKQGDNRAITYYSNALKYETESLSFLKRKGNILLFKEKSVNIRDVIDIKK